MLYLHICEFLRTKVVFPADCEIEREAKTINCHLMSVNSELKQKIDIMANSANGTLKCQTICLSLYSS